MEFSPLRLCLLAFAWPTTGGTPGVLTPVSPHLQQIIIIIMPKFLSPVDDVVLHELEALPHLVPQLYPLLFLLNEVPSSACPSTKRGTSTAIAAGIHPHGVAHTAPLAAVVGKLTGSRLVCCLVD